MPIKGILGGAGVKPLGYGLGGAAEEETDPNFNQTVLLLHGDGSEGEGNTSNLGNPNYKAFRDNSTSTHAIVVNGDAYGNDFSPYYYADGYWSSYHISNSGYYFPHSSDYNLGSGEFTVEFWMNANDLVANQYICGQVGSGGQGSDTAIQIYISNADGRLTLYLSGGGAAIETPAASISANTWHFVSCVRQSNTLRIYVDGVQKQSGSYSGTVLDSAGGFGIGQTGEYVGGGFKGFLSNLRLVVGSCLRDDGTTFSVPTTPLTSTGAETKILTAQSNRFIDNSPTGRTATLSNTPKISTNTPFTVTKTANVGSGFFDGTGDELEITNSSDFAFGTGDFQISLWVYLLENSGGLVGLTGGTATGYWVLTANSGTLYFQKAHNSSDLFSTTLPSLHAWHFIEVSRVSSTTKMFIDGVQTNTTSDTTDYNQTGQTLDIGDHGGHGEPKGYIADVRIIKGSGVTSSTLPTTSLTSTGSETKLLTCQYSGAVRNVGFVDDSKYNHQITRNGDTTMGTFSPFSLEDTYWSNYLNGNHPIEIADSGNGLDLTGDFTIEFWAYEPKIATTNGTVNIYISINTLDGFQFSNNGTNNVLSISGSVFSSTTAPLNQWNHIAIVRSGSGSNNISYYLNGTREAQGTNTDSIATTSMMLGGQDRGGTTGYHGFFGYFSNFRILKGTALYSGASITVPTEPLTAITNTSLLTCQSNRFVDNSTNGMALTTDSSSPAQIQPFSPFAPSRSYSKDAVGGSAYFDGTGDRLTVVDGASIGTGDFTISAWVYRTANGTFPVILDTRSSDSDTKPVIYTDGSTLYYYTAGAFRITGSSAINNNEWIFVRLVKESSVTKLFVNGTQVGSDYADTNNYSPINDWEIGSRHTNEHYWPGYISNLDVTLTALSGTTVPTAPTTSDSNTLFLLNFNNAGIIDRTTKNVLRTVGNTRIITTDKKLGTGSLVFDGNDYLEAVNTEDRELFTPATGDMTWEMFVKFDVIDGLHTLFGKYGSGSEYFFYYDNGNTDWRLVYHASTYTWDDNSITTGTWYHIAVVKDGTTNYLFKNGTSLGTNTATYNTTQTGRNFVLGTSFNGSNAALYHLKGKLDEVRVTRVARYTSNFTAPTKAFPNR